MKTTVAYSKCNCLHSLLYKDSGQLWADVATVVANYALHHMQSPKAAQDQTFIDLPCTSQKSCNTRDEPSITGDDEVRGLFV
jgi:formyltetrahydrofolate hydrolase